MDTEAKSGQPVKVLVVNETNCLKQHTNLLQHTVYIAASCRKVELSVPGHDQVVCIVAHSLFWSIISTLWCMQCSFCLTIPLRFNLHGIRVI